MITEATTSIPSVSRRGTGRLPRWLRSEAIYLAVLLAAILICWLPRLKGPIDLRWDGGVYYILGTSLATGQGYRLLSEPGNIEANQYPPLLPAIIAAHQLVLGTNDPDVVGRWLRFTYFLIFSLYILTVYLVARGRLPAKYALLTALTCLFSLFNYFLSDLCFPEIPFALATTLFVLCNRKSEKRAYSVLAALLAVAAYALRTTGIALLAAWVGESIFKKDFKRAAIRSAVSAVAVFGWMFYISAVESREQYKHPAYEYQRANYLFYNVSYTRNAFLLKEPFAPEMGAPSFGDIAARFLRNLKSMSLSMGAAISSTQGIWEIQWKILLKFLPLHLNAFWVVDLALIVLSCLILAGVGIELARRQWLIPLYILFSLGIICLTPWPEQFARYLVPLVPFLALSLYTLLLKLQELFRVRWGAMAPILAGAVVTVILLQQAVAWYWIYSRRHQRVIYHGRHGEEVAYRLFFYNEAQRAFDAGIDWLKSRAKPNEVIASSMPHWVYLRTGLKSVMPPFEPDPVEAQRLLDTVPVNYMFVEEGLALGMTKYLLPVAQTFPDQWRRVYSASFINEGVEETKGSFEIYQRIEE